MNRRFLLFVVPLLVGCGSTAAPPPSVSTPTPDPTRFTPNYASALDAGRQWADPSISVRVLSSPGQNLAETFLTAKSQWEAQYGTLFDLTLTTSTEARIVVSLVPEGSLGGNTIGLTTITFRSSDARIVSAQIELDSSLEGALLTQVLAHELGHALGIDGHSPSRDDVMFPRAHLPLVITERDRNTLLAINADRIPATRKKDDGNQEVTVVCRYERP